MPPWEEQPPVSLRSLTRLTMAPMLLTHHISRFFWAFNLLVALALVSGISGVNGTAALALPALSRNPQLNTVMFA